VQGGFTITLASGESADVRAGDAVVLPYCDVHTMGSPPDTQAVSIAELVPMPPWTEMPVVRIRGGGAPAQILCGYLHCTDLLFNPLLRTLPRLIVVRPGTEQAGQWRQATLRYAVDQGAHAVGGLPPLLARLPELVLVDCLRQYALELPPERTGWLAALRDPVLARALMLLHARPAEPWTVDSLAQKAAVSRSVLADRFAQTLDVSPMRYLTQWRMQLAADLLRTQPTLGIAEVAGRVGYESEAAFSRAFKRCFGAAPASWARRDEALAA
jgi:AraC-like DNA-binding protein